MLLSLTAAVAVPSRHSAAALQAAEPTTLQAAEPTTTCSPPQPHDGVTYSKDLIGPECDPTEGSVWPTCGQRWHAATLTSCSSVQGHGIETRNWLVGPFTSTGGYDWWYHESTLPKSVTNTGSMTGVGSYTITFHEGAPPADGTAGAVLGLPPFHNHHSKLTLHGVAYDQEVQPACFGDSGVEVVTTECQERDMLSNGFYSPLNLGADAVDSSYGGDGTSSVIVDPHGTMVFLFNDVRPDNSTAQVWYANFTVTLVDDTVVSSRALRPIYQTIQSHAHRLGTTFATINIPSDVPSFMAWEGQFGWSGHLVGNSQISHINTHPTRFE